MFTSHIPGFRISSHTFAEARRRKEKSQQADEEEEEENQLESFSGYFLETEGKIESSIPNLDLGVFVLPPHKRKLVYLEPGTSKIPEGTAFHHF